MSDREAVTAVLLLLLIGTVCAGGYRAYAEREPLHSFTHPSNLPYGCQINNYRLNWSVDYGHLVCEPMGVASGE